MLTLSFRPCARRLLPVLATSLILASGCSDREGSAEGTNSQAVATATSKDLFVNDCAACHGVDGSGNGPLAAELKVAPTNLRLLKQSKGGRFPLLAVQRSITGNAMPRAHGLPDMPIWGRQWIRQGLTDAEMKARAISISSYLASIQD